MKATLNSLPPNRHWLFCILALGLTGGDRLTAVTTDFFAASQGTNLVAAGATSDTISSVGYLFTYTRDKLFTGGVGLTNPVGRSVRVPWPAGLEAQAVTTGPALSGAKFTLRRQDGQPFAISSFTAKLLANTAGAGASIEIMPKLAGEDARNDPFYFGATGYYGQVIPYQSPQLAGYDAYVISLYVDFALLNLTVVDASLPPPVLELLPLTADEALLSWPTNYSGFVLEQKSTLDATNWETVPEPASLVGENYQAPISLTNRARFFRLRRMN